MSRDIWSRQFYKALGAVGNLTEVEKLRLANMLIALSGKHNTTNVDANKIFSFKNKQQQEITPYDHQPLRSEYEHTLSIEDVPKNSCGNELYKIHPSPQLPETTKTSFDVLFHEKP